MVRTTGNHEPSIRDGFGRFASQQCGVSADSKTTLGAGVKMLQGGGGIFKSAAVAVLRMERRLMTTGEITKISIEKQLINCQGRTPEATMASALYTDVKRKGNHSVFTRPQEGHFGLREWEEEGFIPDFAPLPPGFFPLPSPSTSKRIRADYKGTGQGSKRYARHGGCSSRSYDDFDELTSLTGDSDLSHTPPSPLLCSAHSYLPSCSLDPEDSEAATQLLSLSDVTLRDPPPPTFPDLRPDAGCLPGGGPPAAAAASRGPPQGLGPGLGPGRPPSGLCAALDLAGPWGQGPGRAPSRKKPKLSLDLPPRRPSGSGDSFAAGGGPPSPTTRALLQLLEDPLGAPPPLPALQEGFGDIGTTPPFLDDSDASGLSCSMEVAAAVAGAPTGASASNSRPTSTPLNTIAEGLAFPQEGDSQGGLLLARASSAPFGAAPPGSPMGQGLGRATSCPQGDPLFLATGALPSAFRAHAVDRAPQAPAREPLDSKLFGTAERLAREEGRVRALEAALGAHPSVGRAWLALSRAYQRDTSAPAHVDKAEQALLRSYQVMRACSVDNPAMATFFERHFPPAGTAAPGSDAASITSFANLLNCLRLQNMEQQQQQQQQQSSLVPGLPRSTEPLMPLVPAPAVTSPQGSPAAGLKGLPQQQQQQPQQHLSLPQPAPPPPQNPLLSLIPALHASSARAGGAPGPLHLPQGLPFGALPSHLFPPLPGAPAPFTPNLSPLKTKAGAKPGGASPAPAKGRAAPPKGGGRAGPKGAQRGPKQGGGPKQSAEVRSFLRAVQEYSQSLAPAERARAAAGASAVLEHGQPGQADLLAAECLPAFFPADPLPGPGAAGRGGPSGPGPKGAPIPPGVVAGLPALLTGSKAGGQRARLGQRAPKGGGPPPAGGCSTLTQLLTGQCGPCTPQKTPSQN